MRVFGISCRCCGWLAVLAVGAFVVEVAHAGGQGEKIRFSEPNTPTPVIASNLTTTLSPGSDRLNPQPSAFHQAQEDLLRPFKEALEADDPMRAVTSLPLPKPQQYQQRPMNRHAKKVLDQQRNWAFTDFDELYPEPTMEEAFGVSETDPAALEKAAASVIQRYYDKSNLKPDAKLGQKSLQPYDPRKDDFTGAAFKASIARDLPPGGEEMTFTTNEPIFGKNIFLPGKSPDNNGKVALDFGNPGKFGTSDDELAAQKHRAEFSHLLDPSQSATPMQDKLFADPAKFAQPALFAEPTSLTQPNQASTQPYRSVLYPVGITDPASASLRSSVYDDPTAAALGLPNPLQPKPQPPVNTVQSIQNMLDPYKANMPKRNF